MKGSGSAEVWVNIKTLGICQNLREPFGLLGQDLVEKGKGFWSNLLKSQNDEGPTDILLE